MAGNNLWQQLWEKHRQIPWAQRLYFLNWLSREEQAKPFSLNEMLSFNGGSWWGQQFFRLLILLNVPILFDLLHYGYWLPLKKTWDECNDYIFERKPLYALIKPLMRLNSHVIDFILAPFLLSVILIQAITSLPIVMLRLWLPHLNPYLFQIAEFYKDYLTLGLLKAPLHGLIGLMGTLVAKITLTPLRLFPLSYYIGAVGVICGMGLFAVRTLLDEQDQPVPLSIPTAASKMILPDREGNAFFKALFLVASIMLLPLSCLALPSFTIGLVGGRYAVKGWRLWQGPTEIPTPEVLAPVATTTEPPKSEQEIKLPESVPPALNQEQSDKKGMMVDPLSSPPAPVIHEPAPSLAKQNESELIKPKQAKKSKADRQQKKALESPQEMLFSSRRPTRQKASAKDATMAGKSSSKKRVGKKY